MEMKKEHFPWLFLALLVMDMSMIDHVTAGCNSNRPGGVQWANKWDGRAYFDCGTGKSRYDRRTCVAAMFLLL